MGAGRIRQFGPLHCREGDGRNAFRAIAWSTPAYGHLNAVCSQTSSHRPG